MKLWIIESRLFFITRCQESPIYVLPNGKALNDYMYYYDGNYEVKQL